MKIKHSLLAATTLAAGSLSAQVTFDFNDTGDTEGFAVSTATSLSQDSFNGGSLKVTGAQGGGDFYESSTRAAQVSFGASSPLADELALAYDFGGTISFDVTIFESDINWVDSDRPGILEFQLTLSGTGNDTEIGLLSVPSVGNSVTKTVSMSIVQGSGSQFNGTNGTINFDDATSGSISFGFKDQNDFISSASFYLDNVTVTAIPEPSTFASLAGLLALGAAVIRRRS
ncbi:PEP-CTERM sorting domain-containing protein [Coraliomargarita sp. SDUM461003]|uniref:PEP-CTERM sorting domain-containing protein n=1 Tax=Thalassobacterium maritimum TaxID=3041265 RepID=A0ABU1ARJ4_9BACT|nr:PEP-CTERM sorting domain-containing protein [Coraliomargarita sp. SDUM461003]MDQ8206779.1 PEP-CTERM sorting domain-containing protein [Coraliomargarita sp. SDUM461003]